MSKLLFDFFPVVLFFVTYKMYDDPQEGIIAATAVIIAATCVQVAISWFRHRRVEKMHLITLAVVVALGGVTIALNDEIFVKWKPTAVNWLFAAVFLASEFVGRKNLVRRLMDAKIELPAQVWTRLNLSWVAFFTLMGALNLYVVYNFDTDTWVNFKLFGLLGLTLVFVLLQAVYLMRHVSDDEDAGEHG
ncbi:MAG: septation protein A [Gammaproteobacteria bacterium]|nr:septation protein A [Gammaproteobacteria bacterium]